MKSIACLTIVTLCIILNGCGRVGIIPTQEPTPIQSTETPDVSELAQKADATAVPAPTPLSTRLIEDTPLSETHSIAMLSGELKKWHPITLSFEGPQANESDDDPNPFLDYRLQVTFTGPSQQRYDVPGFFDGGGDGSGTGNIWRVHFTPDESGNWHYTVSFRQGVNIAINLDSNTGTGAGFDGSTGSFHIAALDREAPGFLQFGRLETANNYYFKFRDGSYWLKGGTGSPENFLAYSGFDDTIGTHDYQEHISDWNPGDPVWDDGQGKAIIGVLNYLASKHVNSIYFLVMNIGGDGKDIWPFAGFIDPNGNPANDNIHYDISKLWQWEIVFEHAQRRGIFLHFVFGEAEEANRQELGDSNLSVERMLYYREIIARFGHHNALQWNISEEFNQSASTWNKEDVDKIAAYIKAIDPYDHPITAHGDWSELWGDPLLGATSYQYYPEYRPDSISYGDKVESDRLASQSAGRPIPIFVDEPNRTLVGDSEYHNDEDWPFPSGASFQRKYFLWPVYFSGGGGIEYTLEDLLKTEDFKRYDPMWQYTWYARKFMEENLPFWEMEPADDLLSGEAIYNLEDGEVFAKRGQIYALYLPIAEPGGLLDLSDSNGRFQKRWYNPRTGQFEGISQIIEGGRSIYLGEPPSRPEDDWVVLFESLDN